jgi:hypothetical protein
VREPGAQPPLPLHALRARLRRPPPVWLWVAAGVAAFVAAGLAVAIPLQLRAKSESEAKQLSTDRAAAVREAARLRVVQQPRAGRLVDRSGARAFVAVDDATAPAPKRLRIRRAEVLALEVTITATPGRASPTGA